MKNPPADQRGMPLFQKAVLALVGTTLVASVAARVFLDAPSHSSSLPTGARGFAAESTANHPDQAAWWQSILPVVTEASLFGLIGFALGYTTRKVFKLALILIAVAFVVVQVLVARGELEVDWGSSVRAIQAWVLNLHPDVPIAQFLRTRIPTAIAFVTCLFVGFRRG